MLSFWICTGRRFIEVMGLNVLLSAMIYGLYKAGVIASTEAGCFLSLLAGAGVFILQNIRWLRRCRLELPSKRIFYATNFTAYGIFMLINIALCYILDSETYTWIFAITKFMRYTELHWSSFTSAMLFHAFMIGMIIVLPLGMDDETEDMQNDSIIQHSREWDDRVYSVGDFVVAVRQVPHYRESKDIFTLMQKLFVGAEDKDLKAILGIDEEEISE